MKVASKNNALFATMKRHLHDSRQVARVGAMTTNTSKEDRRAPFLYAFIRRGEMFSNAVNAKLCQGKDVLERMNYLYQASRLMAIRSNNPVAASYYGNIMAGCAKKAVLRMSPDIKRTICKCCQSPLIPGKTAKVRLVSKPTKMVKWTCLTCSGVRKFPTKKGYKLWAEQPEALVEFFDYTPKLKKEKNYSVRNDRINGSLDSMDCKTAEIAKNVEKRFSSNEGKVGTDAENILGKDEDVRNIFSMVQD